MSQIWHKDTMLNNTATLIIQCHWKLLWFSDTMWSVWVTLMTLNTMWHDYTLIKGMITKWCDIRVYDMTTGYIMRWYTIWHLMTNYIMWHNAVLTIKYVTNYSSLSLSLSLSHTHTHIYIYTHIPISRYAMWQNDTWYCMWHDSITYHTI